MSHDNCNNHDDFVSSILGKSSQKKPCDCPACALKELFNKEKITKADKDMLIDAIVEKREEHESRLNEANRKMHDSIELIKRALDLNEGNIGAISVAIVPLNPMVPLISDRGELCPAFHSMHAMSEMHSSVIKVLVSDI